MRRVAHAAVGALRADAVVLPVRQADGSPAFACPTPWWSAGQRRRVLTLAAAMGCQGASGEVVRLPAASALAARVLVLVGVGPLDLTDRLDARGAEQLRAAVGAGVRAVSGAVVVVCPTSSTAVEATVDGALLGADAGPESRRLRRTFTFAVHSPAESRALVERRGVICHAVVQARRWVDAPSSRLGPRDLAREVTVLAEDLPLTVRALWADDLLGQGLASVHAVGRASDREPGVLVVEHRPEGAGADLPHVCLVGKGVTFDAGGISIKPADGMWLMKADMAGAAAVLAAVVAAARLRIAVRVTAVVALADNVLSGDALRPGDVLRTYGGTTVEVLDTDAEGRLLLADVLALAGSLAPDLLVDLATLTGSQRIALGPFTAGVLGDDDACDLVLAASRTAGESLWRMPLDERLRPRLDSDVADLANVGGRQGGMLIAGLFLREFVPAGIPWAHVDMAGPSFHDDAPGGYQERGATGFGVRTILALLSAVASAAVVA